MKKVFLIAAVAVLGLVSVSGLSSSSRTVGQSSTVPASQRSNDARPMTIPLIIRVKGVIKPEPELQTIDLTVTEDGDAQTILSIRAIGTNSPLTLAVLIQDDLVSSIGNEIKPLAEFIRNLPRGSRLMVGYIRSGSLQVRQRFTLDLEKAAKALRPPLGFASAAPYNPYVEIREAIKRFDAQPFGRRAILLVSDGLDISRGSDESSAIQSIDLQRAIEDSQRRSIAVYAFYAPTVEGRSPGLIATGQSSLRRLADETGGRAYFQGTGAPVSFDPFIRELDSALQKQVALTYLSTHPQKGFHRVQVRSSSPGVEIDHPAGYSR